jgi:hypothetical protein
MRYGSGQRVWGGTGRRFFRAGRNEGTQWEAPKGRGHVGPELLVPLFETQMLVGLCPALINPHLPLIPSVPGLYYVLIRGIQSARNRYVAATIALSTAPTLRVIVYCSYAVNRLWSSGGLEKIALDFCFPWGGCDIRSVTEGEVNE